MPRSPVTRTVAASTKAHSRRCALATAALTLGSASIAVSRRPAPGGPRRRRTAPAPAWPPPGPRPGPRPRPGSNRRAPQRAHRLGPRPRRAPHGADSREEHSRRRVRGSREGNAGAGVMRALAANIEEVFREAAARWTLVAYFALSSLFILIFAVAVNLDVVNGALAGAKIFGQNVQMGRQSVDLDKLVLGFESGFAGFLYVVGTFLAIFATAHLVPRLMEKGTVDLYLSRPVGRVPLLLSRYAGGLLLSASNVIYLLGAMWLLVIWKTHLVHPRFFFAAGIILFGIAALMAFAFLIGTLTSSTAVSLMATFG